jgi:hypothetical protein
MPMTSFLHNTGPPHAALLLGSKTVIFSYQMGKSFGWGNLLDEPGLVGITPRCAFWLCTEGFSTAKECHCGWNTGTWGGRETGGYWVMCGWGPLCRYPGKPAGWAVASGHRPSPPPIAASRSQLARDFSSWSLNHANWPVYSNSWLLVLATYYCTSSACTPRLG